jgi:hypothetical protein
MTHLILGINFGFWALQFLFCQNYIIIIIIIIINFIICIEGYMDIFIIYNGIIRPLFCFDYTNFKS